MISNSTPARYSSVYVDFASGSMIVAASLLPLYQPQTPGNFIPALLGATWVVLGAHLVVFAGSSGRTQGAPVGALAFRASNSGWVMVPESSRPLALSICSAAEDDAGAAAGAYWSTVSSSVSRVSRPRTMK